MVPGIGPARYRRSGLRGGSSTTSRSIERAHLPSAAASMSSTSARSATSPAHARSRKSARASLGSAHACSKTSSRRSQLTASPFITRRPLRRSPFEAMPAPWSSCAARTSWTDRAPGRFLRESARRRRGTRRLAGRARRAAPGARAPDRWPGLLRLRGRVSRAGSASGSSGSALCAPPRFSRVRARAWSTRMRRIVEPAMARNPSRSIAANWRCWSSRK